MKVYSCNFKHCQHETLEILESDAIKVGTRYMHEDCAKINDNINKIKDTYYKKVSSTVVMKQLVSAINNIVFTKKIDSGYLLYALNFALSNKMTISSPYGLHYIIDNKRIKDSWNKVQAEIISSKIKDNIKENGIDNKEKNTTFKYDKENHIGFENILKGDS